MDRADLRCRSEDFRRHGAGDGEAARSEFGDRLAGQAYQPGVARVRFLAVSQLEADAPETDHCGSCHACLDICPTRAFPAPYQIDARRCISYLTIEHKGHIAREFREAIGNRIYGCDDCLAVCPWNKFAATAHEIAFQPRVELTRPLLGELATLDDAAFREVFRGSAVKRIGRDRFVRNVLIAIGNSGETALAGAAEARLSDSSPLVRAMAVWALSKLLSGADFAGLSERYAVKEDDTAVAAEWRAVAA